MTLLRITAVTLMAAAAALTLRAGADVRQVLLGVDGRANATAWIAADGDVVAVVWGASASGRTDVFASTSRDAGGTFGVPVRVNTVPGEARLGGELPPRVALHRTRASAAPDIVVLWTARGAATAIKAARSRDGGRTFDAPVALQADGAPGDRGWPSLAVDDRGAPHALWLDHRGLAADTSGQATHRHHGATGSAAEGAGVASKSALYYAGVQRPGAERALARGVCYCCKTALAAGPGRTLYAAWRHVYAGNIRDIAFTASRDGGRTFSDPVRVSDDGWQIAGCPDDGPALAVDATGAVHVVWPTVIAGPEPEGALFYARSDDGRTFTPRMRVPALGGAKPGRPYIAVGSGAIAIAWDELRGGKRVAAVRTLRRRSGGQLSADVPVILGEGAAAYPVLAPVAGGVVAAWTSGPAESSRIAVRRLVQE